MGEHDTKLKPSDCVQAMINDTMGMTRAYDLSHQFSEREKCQFAVGLLEQLKRQIERIEEQL